MSGREATSMEGEGTLGSHGPGRIVLVVGRQTCLDPGPLIAAAWQQNSKLLVLVLGLPLTPDQQRVCEDALEAAGRGLIELEERVVLDLATVADTIRDGDRVVVSVSALERQELGPIESGPVEARLVPDHREAAKLAERARKVCQAHA